MYPRRIELSPNSPLVCNEFSILSLRAKRGNLSNICSTRTPPRLQRGAFVTNIFKSGKVSKRTLPLKRGFLDPANLTTSFDGDTGSLQTIGWVPLVANEGQIPNGICFLIQMVSYLLFLCNYFSTLQGHSCLYPNHINTATTRQVHFSNLLIRCYLIQYTTIHIHHLNQGFPVVLL